MRIDVDPVTSHLRVFLDDAKCAKNKDPYDSIMTVQHLNNNEVYISGLKGVMSKEIFRAVVSYFFDEGIARVTYERDGIIKTVIRAG